MDVISFPKKEEQGKDKRVAVYWKDGEVSIIVCKEFVFSAVDPKLLLFYKEEISEDSIDMPDSIVNTEEVKTISVEEFKIE